MTHRHLDGSNSVISKSISRYRTASAPLSRQVYKKENARARRVNLPHHWGPANHTLTEIVQRQISQGPRDRFRRLGWDVGTMSRDPHRPPMMCILAIDPNVDESTQWQQLQNLPMRTGTAQAGHMVQSAAPLRWPRPAQPTQAIAWAISECLRPEPWVARNPAANYFVPGATGSLALAGFRHLFAVRNPTPTAGDSCCAVANTLARRLARFERD